MSKGKSLRDWLREKNPQTPTTDDKWETAMSWNIFMVEKECSQRITEDYPLMKFFSLVENLQTYFKKEQEQMDKAKRGKK